MKRSNSRRPSRTPSVPGAGFSSISMNTRTGLRRGTVRRGAASKRPAPGMRPLLPLRVRLLGDERRGGESPRTGLPCRARSAAPARSRATRSVASSATDAFDSFVAELAADGPCVAGAESSTTSPSSWSRFDGLPGLLLLSAGRSPLFPLFSSPSSSRNRRQSPRLRVDVEKCIRLSVRAELLWTLRRPATSASAKRVHQRSNRPLYRQWTR